MRANLHERIRGLLCILGLVATVAQAAWTPSGAPGASTLALSDAPGEMVIAASARLLAVGTEGKESIVLVQPDSGAVLGTLSVDKKPIALAIDSAGAKLYALQDTRKAVYAYDVASRTTIASWSLPGDLVALALRPDGSELLVADRDGKRIVALNPATGAIVRQKGLTARPQRLAVNGANTRILVGAEGGHLLTLDAATLNVVSDVALGSETRSVGFWDGGGLAVVVQKNADALSLVNVENGSVVGRVEFSTDPEHGTVDDAGAKAYVSTKDDIAVSRVDLANRRSDGRFILPSQAAAILFDAAAKAVYVSLPKDKLVLRVDPTQHPLLGEVVLRNRLRDIAVNNTTHEAAAIAEKVSELERLRLVDRSLEALALPDKPDRIAIDVARNLAVIAIKNELRFANLAVSPATLLATKVDVGSKVNALAVDPTRGLTIVTTQGSDDQANSANRRLHIVDNIALAQAAAIASAEKLQAVAIDSQRGRAYFVAEQKKLVVFDLASRTFVGTTALPFQAGAIALDPQLGIGVLADPANDKVHVVDLTSNAVVQSYAVPRGPAAVDLQKATHTAVIVSTEADQLSLLDLATRTLTPQYAQVESPFAVATSERFNLALVLSGERDEIVIVPLANPVPTLATVSPVEAVAGRAALTLSAQGSGFVDQSRVLFGPAELSTRWLGPGSLEATVPASLMTVPVQTTIRVRSPGPAGGDSAPVAFAVVPPLAITSINPLGGIVGSQVAITGVSFLAATPANQVSFPGANSTLVPAAVLSATPTQLVVTVPAGAQTGPITVTNSRGTATSPTFTVFPPLSISGISPASGLVGSQVTITGISFETIAANNHVAFQGANATSIAATVQSATDTQLVVVVPTGAQTGPITVTNSRGTASSPTFTVIPPLSITAISPTSGRFGATVTITGVSIDPVAANNQVTFVGGNSTPVPASVQSATSTQLVVIVPVGAQTGPITVSNAFGRASSATFTVLPPPTITSISPTSGSVLSVVTIAGSAFDPVPANNSVTFGGVSATVLTATTTSLLVRVPTNAVTGAVVVTTQNGSATGPIFTVLPPRDNDVQIISTPPSLSIYQGSAGTAQLQLPSTGTTQFSGVATLSATGAPAGAVASFAPGAAISSFQASSVTLSVSASTPPGDYTITVTAEGDAGGEHLTRTTTIALSVLSSAGITGVKGRFVTPNRDGIAGVIVRADNGAATQPQTTTDAAGNFQLVGLSAGDYTLRFDATPANPLYPIWPYTITVQANAIAVIPDWTINPPPSDDKFTAIANATQAQSITDARFPGLEIRLPAGATITGWDGVRKSRIAVEKVDIAKLPVTAPPTATGSAYQLYFGTPMGGIPSQPIPVTLPNDVEAEPGESVDVWFFDGSPMGGSGTWKVAGQGIVGADGKTVAMPNGTGIPRFCGVCGLMCLGKLPPAPDRPPGPPPTCAGNPVDLSNGQEMPKSRGMSCGGLTPIDAGMSYNPVDAFNGIGGTSASIGFGWILDYDIAFLPFEGPQKRLILPGDNRVNFTDDGSGTYRVVDDPRFDGATIRATNVSTNEWELKFRDGRIWRFKPYPGVPTFIRNGPPTFVHQIVDAQGNVLTVNRQSEGKIVSIGTADRNITLAYGANGFASQMSDTAGRVTRFAYNAKNRLSSVTDPDNRVTSYTYVDDTEFTAPAVCGAQTSMGERLKTITYPGRPNPTVNEYGPGRRVLRQVGYDGLEHRFAYRVTGACVTKVSSPNTVCSGVSCPDVDSWENFQAGWRIFGGKIVSTTVTQPNGKTYTHNFDSRGASTASTDAFGQQTTTRFDASHRVIETIDALGRSTKFSYDTKGNVIQTIDALGRITQIGYDPVWNKPTSVTRFDDAGQPFTTSLVYDAGKGTLLSTTNPAGETISFTYTTRGELETVRNPLGKVTRFEYNLVGDLTQVTDPLLHVTKFGYDAAGRRTTLTDPLTFVTTTAYNGVDSVTRLTDARSKNTDLAYDPAGRLQSVTNARGYAIESYGYDAGDRLSTKTDALSKSSNYQYDASGRLSRRTDRKGQVTTYEYDGEDRVSAINRPEGRTTFSYDVVGRLVLVSDSVGTVAYSYDTVDRLVREKQTAAGVTSTFDYQYDKLDRRVSRTVSGVVNETTTYGYDRAGRLTSIGYRGQSTTLEYDAAGRLKKKVLPNAIVQTTAYDDADRLLEIRYANPDGSAIEVIGYTYDENGRRISETRSVGRAPETPFTAVYDAADRMTSITMTDSGKAFTLSYDDNGRLVGKVEQGNSANATSYVWDSLDRLVSLSSPGLVASFQYDALGRRIARTVNGESTRYLYDGAQAVAEIRSGGTETILTGLAIDDVIARYATAGVSVYLNDALNTVLQQTRDDRSTTYTYSYSAYGEVSSQPSGDGNSIQYTGRENDRTSLYYYRARYYDPVLKRFISQDPIGVLGGSNFYSYVGGNPLSYVDFLGLQHFRIGIEPPTANAINNGVLNPSIDPGHTFAYLTDANGNIVSILSVGPSTPIGAMNKNSFLNGTLPAVSNWPITGHIDTYAWKLSPQQYQQCAQQFNKAKNNPGNYSPTNQCTSAAVDLAKQCGLSIPSGSSPVNVPSIPLVFPGYSNNLPNPYGLQQQLNQTMTPTPVPSSQFRR